MEERENDNVVIARRAYAAFDAGGREAALEFLDPRIEWRMWEGFARGPRVFHGHDGVREVLAIFEENMDEFRVEPHEFIGVADHVVVPVRLTGRSKGDGDPLAFELVHVWTTAGGRATRLDVHASREAALRSVGLPPTG